MGLVFMVWQVGTPARHAQDAATAIEEVPGALGDVVLQRVTGHNRDKPHKQSGLHQQDVLQRRCRARRDRGLVFNGLWI
jgi:hypothetical protein